MARRRARSRALSSFRRLPHRARAAVLGVAGVAGVLGYRRGGVWWALHGDRVLSVAQVVLPALGLVAAGALALYAHRRLAERDRRLARARSLEPSAPADRRTGKPLEHGTAKLLELEGYLNPRVHGGANDRGLDVSAEHPVYGLVVVQCKDYLTKPVGSPEAQAFLGTCWDILAIDGRLADVAMFVTTARFTPEAHTLLTAPRLVTRYGQTSPRTVIPVDGDALAAWRRGEWSPLPAPARQEVI